MNIIKRAKLELMKVSVTDLIILGAMALLVMLAWGIPRMESLLPRRNALVFQSMKEVAIYPSVVIKEKDKIEKISKAPALPSSATQVVLKGVLVSTATPSLAQQPVLLKVIPPLALNEIMPEYPMAAIEKGSEGTVVLNLLILKNGVVGEVKTEASSGYPVLDQAAIQASKIWRFEPAKRGAEAIEVWFKVPIRFQLKS
jgi:TonB family protein